MSKVSTLSVYALRLRSEAARVADRFLASIGGRRRFYGSKGQDRWIIEKIFPGQIGGYFVEVGAGDGRTHSNSFVLERDYEWTGILIEADPRAASKIESHRRCVSVCACVDSISRRAEFLRFGHLGGIVAEDTDNSIQVRRQLLKRHSKNIIEVQTEALETILELNAAPAVIDYLSLDVEGAEYRILATFPFERYSIRALTVERPTQEIHQILTKAGYVLSHISRYDGFYLSSEEAARCRIVGRQFAGVAKKRF